MRKIESNKTDQYEPPNRSDITPQQVYVNAPTMPTSLPSINFTPVTGYPGLYLQQVNN